MATLASLPHHHVAADPEAFASYLRDVFADQDAEQSGEGLAVYNPQAGQGLFSSWKKATAAIHHIANKIRDNPAARSIVNNIGQRAATMAANKVQSIADGQGALAGQLAQKAIGAVAARARPF